MERAGDKCEESAPDSPIDLSQLSTRCRDLTSRSASESCLAPASAAKKRRFKDPPPPPSAPANELKYRSMSNADIAGYRSTWLEKRNEPPQSAAAAVAIATTRDSEAAGSPAAALESLKQRCMSDSRLGGQQTSAWPSAFTGGYPALSTPGLPASVRAGTADLLRSATDNSQLEFLLRRTASESFLASSRSGEPAGSAAMDMFVRQRQAIQHWQQLMFQQQQQQQPALHQHCDGAESSSSSTSSSYLSPPWLLSLFGYSQILQTLQPGGHQQPMAAIHDPAPGSAQKSAGPSSPTVAASSVSGSDGEGGELEEDDDVNGFAHGKKRSPRALTGKHVRLGTGASPTTLHTLRLKIEERQRMKSVKKGLAASPFAGPAAKKNAKLKARAK